MKKLSVKTIIGQAEDLERALRAVVRAKKALDKLPPDVRRIAWNLLMANGVIATMPKAVADVVASNSQKYVSRETLPRRERSPKG